MDSLCISQENKYSDEYNHVHHKGDAKFTLTLWLFILRNILLTKLIDNDSILTEWARYENHYKIIDKLHLKPSNNAPWIINTALNKKKIRDA